MRQRIGREDGLTLIELLVALALSAFVIAGLYRTFVSQHKVYIVQEQVADVQQNVRATMGQMVQSIRMAGFGKAGMVFDPIVNTPTPDGVGLVGIAASTATIEPATEADNLLPNQIKVSRLKEGDTVLFNTEDKRFISIDGLESREILAIDDGRKILTLNRLSYEQEARRGEREVRYGREIRKTKAVVYPLRVEPYGQAPMGGNIEKVRYQYFDEKGNETADPSKIKMIRVTVVGMTEKPDPDYQGEKDKHRRRVIESRIAVRNLKE